MSVLVVFGYVPLKDTLAFSTFDSPDVTFVALSNLNTVKEAYSNVVLIEQSTSDVVEIVQPPIYPEKERVDVGPLFYDVVKDVKNQGVVLSKDVPVGKSMATNILVKRVLGNPLFMLHLKMQQDASVKFALDKQRHIHSTFVTANIEKQRKIAAEQARAEQLQRLYYYNYFGSSNGRVLTTTNETQLDLNIDESTQNFIVLVDQSDEAQTKMDALPPSVSHCVFIVVQYPEFVEDASLQFLESADTTDLGKTLMSCIAFIDMPLFNVKREQDDGANDVVTLLKNAMQARKNRVLHLLCRKGTDLEILQLYKEHIHAAFEI
jgi:hypothetical protein